MRIRTSPGRLAGLVATLAAATMRLFMLTPGMELTAAAITGMALGCLVLFVNARLRLIELN